MVTEHKQRAVALLFILGSILALVATWDDRGDRPAQARVSRIDE
jgi:hypothetical protein